MSVSSVMTYMEKESKKTVDICVCRLPRWLQRQRICLPMQEMQKMEIRSLGQEDPLEEEMATHSNILGLGTGKSHGQRSLEGHSPWSCKELDLTEHTYVMYI